MNPGGGLRELLAEAVQVHVNRVRQHLTSRMSCSLYLVGFGILGPATPCGTLEPPVTTQGDITGKS